MPDEPSPEQLEALLQAVAAAEPTWYPAAYAGRTGAARDSLDEPLNRLRMAGLVRLTDWEAGKGQGYVVTTEGRRALRNPAMLRRPPKPAADDQPPRAPRAMDGTPVTRLLISAQAAMFLIGLAQAYQLGAPAALFLERGGGPIQAEMAVSTAALAAGRWWTLLTYALVHGGLLHLAMNLMGHALEASFAERLWGSARFAALYLAAVAAGGAGAVLAAPSGVTVGSSGGLCGVIAAQAVWVAAYRHNLRDADRQVWTRHFVQIAVLITLISLVPGVSWGGHLGGALGGAAAAALLLRAESPNRLVRAAVWTVTGLLPFAIAAALWAWLRRAGG